jgi:hypothetical protein
MRITEKITRFWDVVRSRVKGQARDYQQPGFWVLIIDDVISQLEHMQGYETDREK